MQYTSLTAILLLASTVSAQTKGFNYGATLENGACRDGNNFRSLFQRANSLAGTSGFTSARLYTTIQCGTANDPTSAIQAAIDTGTSLLLGLWGSAGSDAFNNEVTALTRAIQQYPTLADRVIGISVGSEDLYRSSPQGVANNAGVGANAAAITDYIGRVRKAISGTSLAGKPVGHVDTWTAWVLPENAPVAQASDWLGHNSFPYFETTRPNSIDQARDNFYSALSETERIAGGKPVFVTETGWPHTGAQAGQAVASVQNAERYWKTVGCSLFGTRNTWWYTLEDANTNQVDISFGVTTVGSNTPIYDLSCSNQKLVDASSSSSSSSASTSSTGVSDSSPQSQTNEAASSSAVSSASGSTATIPTVEVTGSGSVIATATRPGQNFASSQTDTTLATGTSTGTGSAPFPNNGTASSGAGLTGVPINPGQSSTTTVATNPSSTGVQTGIASSRTTLNLYAWVIALGLGAIALF